MSGKHYKYITETSDKGISLILPEEIYNTLASQNFSLEYRADRNSRLKKSINGKRKYFGTLKSYVEKQMKIQIVDFVDGNRLNFKRSNLIVK